MSQEQQASGRVAHSAEARWFGAGPAPAELVERFGAMPGARSQGERTDRYLRLAGAVQAGIKLRGGKLETKIRLCEPRAEVASWCAPELWAKTDVAAGELEALVDGWSSPEAWIQVGKQRVGRTFAVTGGRLEPLTEARYLDAGASEELTALRVAGAQCWTYALESFGADLLTTFATLARELHDHRAAFLTDAVFASYPAWLATLTD